MIVKKYRKVTAFLLAFTLVASALPTRVGWEGIFEETALVANALTTEQISPDSLVLYDDGSIKSFRLSYYIGYYGSFSAKLIITDKALRNHKEISCAFMRRMICSVQGARPQEYCRIAKSCNAAQGKSDNQKRATYFFMIPKSFWQCSILCIDRSREFKFSVKRRS